MYELVIGEKYIVTDITGMVYLGELAAILAPHTLVLKRASWISDTGGRIHDFYLNGQCNGMEIEPCGVAGPKGERIRCLHWAGWSPWPHPLLETQV